MFRYFLSWRYLVSRRTNLIAIIGLCLAVGALIMILSIMTGFLEETKRVLRGSLSDVVVTPIFLPRPDGTEVRADRETTLEVLTADDRVSAATARLVYYGILQQPGYAASGARSEAGSGVLVRTATATLAGVQLVGIDPETELATTDLRAALERRPIDGERVADPDDPFATDGPAPGAVVGEQLFAALGLRVGQVIEVLTATPDAETGAIDQRAQRFTVAGTFRSGENESDLSRILVDREVLARSVGSPHGYSEVCVDLEDGIDESAIGELCYDLALELTARRLLRGDVDREVRPWNQYRTNEQLVGSIVNQRNIMAVLLSLVLLVAGFTVFAIQSMMVTEKRRDVGILAALGATPRELMTLFVMIAVWDVAVGGTIGAVVGTWAAREIDGIEQWLSNTLGVQIINRDLYLFDTIPSQVEASAVAAILVATLLASVLFAALPAWRASHLDPLQAVRNN